MSPLKAIIFIVFLSLMDLEVADARTKLPSLREAIEMVFGLREPTSNLRYIFKHFCISCIFLIA